MSLRTRITFIVSGFTAVIVLIAGWAIHQFTEEDIRAALDQKLEWQVMRVADPDILQKVLAFGGFFRSRSIGTMSVTEQYLERLLDVQIPTRILVGNETVIATNGFPDFSSQALSSGFSNIDEKGEDWRVRTVVFKPPASRSLITNETIAIQSAMTRDSISTTLQDFRERFFAVGIIAIFAAGIGGWFLGGTVVKPIDRLRRHAENVRESEDLSQRIPENLGSVEVKVLATSLNDMLMRLETNVEKTQQALSSSRAFASNVAHELRTPLTAINMNLGSLERHPDMPDDERQTILASVINDHGRLLTILESLRLLARGDLSEEEIFEELDFIQLIRDTVVYQNNQFKDLNVQLHLPENSPMTHAWREGIAVLVRNLIENAHVHARTSKDELRVEIYVGINGKEIRIDVDDNGPGIPKEERDYVLGRFSRGSQAVGSGTGLGLSLVRQQAELHGGSASISDSPLNGTRVTILLPIIT